MAETEIVIEPGRQDIVMTRVFDASPEVVFGAYTDPALVPRWWGPRSLTTEVDRMDVRPGGLWRFVHRDPDGNEYAFKGVYHGIDTPERLVYTFEFEGAPGHVLLATVTFEEVGGGTRMRDLSVFQSVEDRDGMVQAGMESGTRDSMDRLDELIETLKRENAA